MATPVQLRHPESHIIKTGYFGFSWTTLFFGFFPALFRSDFATFLGGVVVSIVIGMLTFGIGLLFISLGWAFMYNKFYTRKLLERGYVLADTSTLNARAAAALGIAFPRGSAPASAEAA